VIIEEGHMPIRYAPLLATLVFVSLGSPATAQQGMDLSWNSCPMTAANTNKSSACGFSSETEQNNLLATFQLQQNVPDFYGVQVTLDVIVDSPTLPDFWHLEAGGCRDGRLAMGLVGGVLTTCTNAYPGNAMQGGGYVFELHPSGQPDRRQIRGTWTRGDGQVVGLTAGVRYYGARLILTIADGDANLCAGCSLPACIILRSTQVLTGSGSGPLITQPLTRNFVTWQGGDPECAQPVQDQRTTWGGVKSLYR
jgi:hypothetical protein